jgi:hypothetical protein
LVVCVVLLASWLLAVGVGWWWRCVGGGGGVWVVVVVVVVVEETTVCFCGAKAVAILEYRHKISLSC